MFAFIINKIAFPLKKVNRTKCVIQNKKVLDFGSQRVHVAIYDAPTQNVRTIIYVHGNTGSLCSNDERMKQYVGFYGIRFISFDQPGYGENVPGKPSEVNLIGATERVYRYVIDDLGVDPANIVVWGRSIGSVGATALAASSTVRALILESAMASAYDIVFHKIFVQIGNGLNNVKRIKFVVKSRITIILGDSDNIIHIRNSYKLLKATNANITLSNYSKNLEIGTDKNIMFCKIHGGTHENLSIEFGEELQQCIKIGMGRDLQ